MPASKTFWNKRAPKYDRKLYKGPNYAARLQRAASAFGDDARVLDVGCATGEITLDLAQHAREIIGIDHAPSMTQIGNAKAQQRGIDNACFKNLEPADPSLDRESFDAITNYSLLHLVDDAPATLARFHELLKPGGHLLTEAPCLGDWNLWWRVLVWLAVFVGMCPRVSALKVADLEAMIAGAGFEIIESKVYNPKSGMQCVLARKV